MTPTDLWLIAAALNVQHVKMSVQNTCEHLLSPFQSLDLCSPVTSAQELQLSNSEGLEKAQLACNLLLFFYQFELFQSQRSF